MITLFFGTIELSSGLAISRKVTLTAHTVADLASQPASLTAADITDILNASSAIMAPFASNPPAAKDQAKSLKIVLTCISVDANGIATVAWSDALNGTPLGKGSGVSLPSALNVKNSGMLLGQVTTTYTPTFASNLIGVTTITDQAYLAPRKQMTCPTHP
jgi:Flp pilus assembly protein TadG